MSSPEFYNVSPPDPVGGARHLTQNPVGIRIPIGLPSAHKFKEAEPLSLGVRVANLGPHGFPFIIDKDHNLIEVVPLKTSPKGRPLLLSPTGKAVEVSHLILDAGGTLRLVDTGGKVIEKPQFQLHPRAQRSLGARAAELLHAPVANFAFKLDPKVVRFPKNFHRPVFVLPNGTVIVPEIGDSEGNVQLTQAGSLIYYGIAVNDVYAYYLTGHKDGAISSNQFPIDAASLAAVTSFAGAHSHTFLNPNALAMEMKTAWVDAATLPNPGDYITMMAKVPVYDRTTDPQHWKQTSATQTIKVALIGMHVVGSTAGHPEMIWASFEHFGNAPNVGYTFVDPSGTTKTQPADAIGGSATWLFTGATSPGTSFTARASSGLNTIDTNFTGSPVQPTSIMRLAPWGAPNNKTPNPLVTLEKSNTQIISLNNDIHSQMDVNDVRSKYLFIGATWTTNGAPGSGNFGAAMLSGNAVGTSHLANSTMETFSQSAVFVDGNPPGPGCLSCHGFKSNSGALSATTVVSHIFDDIQALF